MQMQKVLGHHTSWETRKQALEDYRELLAGIFNKYPWLSRLSLDSLRSLPQYNDWVNRKSSSLLALYGYNLPEHGTVVDSWLSEAVCDFIRSCISSDDLSTVTAYFLRTDESTAEGILSNLTAQILDRYPCVLRRGSDLRDIQTELSGGRDQPGALEDPNPRDSLAGRRRVQALESALVKILNSLPAPAFLIVDRADRCENLSRGLLIQALHNLCIKCAQTVKILIGVRSEFRPDIEDKISEVTYEQNEPCHLLLRIDQTKDF
jgi:hypothetical protein